MPRTGKRLLAPKTGFWGFILRGLISWIISAIIGLIIVAPLLWLGVIVGANGFFWWLGITLLTWLPIEYVIYIWLYRGTTFTH